MAPVEITRTIDPQSHAKERQTIINLEPGEGFTVPFPQEVEPDTGQKLRMSLRIICDIPNENAILQRVQIEGKSRFKLGRWVHLGFRQTKMEIELDELKKGESLTVPTGEDETIKIEMK